MVRMLDRPSQLSLPLPPDETPAWAWDSQALKTDWERVPHPQWHIFRSPQVALDSLQNLAQIDFELNDGTVGFSFHWNDDSTFDREALLRFRLDVPPSGEAGPRKLSLQGHRISDLDFPGSARDEVIPRFFFLRLPRNQTMSIFEAVKLFRRGQEGNHSGRYESFGGQIRPSLHTKAGESWSFHGTFTSQPNLELRFSHYLDGADQIRYRVRLKATHTQANDWTHTGKFIADPAWRHLRIPLPKLSGNASLIFETESSEEKASVHWANPSLVSPSRGGPNVLIYVMDALRARQLSLYGYEKETAPFLRKLGEESLVFEQAYATTSWTKPTVASLMTSLYPMTHGIGATSYTDPVPESVTTLPEYFQKAGYHTAHFSANPLNANLSNLHQGFDVTYTPNAFLETNPAESGKKVRATTINRHLIPWIEAHRDRPFFIYVQTMDTHTPFEAPETPQALRGEGNLEDRYNAEIHANDAALRDLVSALREKKLLENTLLVITADHGEAFGEHGQGGHGTSVYQEEIRIPLVVSHQGKVQPERTKRPANLVDLMPTLLNYCQIDHDPQSVQGVDLLGDAVDRILVSAKFVYPRDEAFNADPSSEAYGIIHQPWKLIVLQQPDSPLTMALYHLENDPQERHNLAEDRPEILKDLFQKFLTFMKQQRRERAAFLNTHLNGKLGSIEPDRLSEEDAALLQSLGYTQ